jgi:hypothetical protein
MSAKKTGFRSKLKPKKVSSKVKCLGCGVVYKETPKHLNGSFCGYHSEECFEKNG